MQTPFGCPGDPKYGLIPDVLTEPFAAQPLKFCEVIRTTCLDSFCETASSFLEAVTRPSSVGDKLVKATNLRLLGDIAMVPKFQLLTSLPTWSSPALVTKRSRYGGSLIKSALVPSAPSTSAIAFGHWPPLPEDAWLSAPQVGLTELQA